jgi:hypothetical protein
MPGKPGDETQHHQQERPFQRLPRTSNQAHQPDQSYGAAHLAPRVFSALRPNPVGFNYGPESSAA